MAAYIYIKTHLKKYYLDKLCTVYRNQIPEIED